MELVVEFREEAVGYILVAGIRVLCFRGSIKRLKCIKPFVQQTYERVTFIIHILTMVIMIIVGILKHSLGIGI